MGIFRCFVLGKGKYCIVFGAFVVRERGHGGAFALPTGSFLKTPAFYSCLLDGRKQPGSSYVAYATGLSGRVLTGDGIGCDTECSGDGLGFDCAP